MHAVREFLDDVHTLCRTERRQNFLIRGVRLAHADIVKNAALDEMAVLEHKGNGVHQLVFVDVLYIDAAGSQKRAANLAAVDLPPPEGPTNATV